MSTIISSVMKQNASKITKSITLSNYSASQHFDEMADNEEKELIAHLQVNQIAHQRDESTFRDNKAIPLPYVRLNTDEGLREKMLYAGSPMTDTKGKTIFNEVVTYFKENNIPLKHIIACATDGAPSMTGKYQSFIAHLKKAIPEVYCIHCVIHRQHLVPKKISARLHDALTLVISMNSVNRMEKSLSALYYIQR